jgi:hypothetical protein
MKSNQNNIPLWLDMTNGKFLTLNERIMHLNDMALKIYNLHPNDYHNRKDYQDIINLRCKIISESERTDGKPD